MEWKCILGTKMDDNVVAEELREIERVAKRVARSYACYP